ncbi:hypothetical protein QEM15_004980 [Pseudomonas putida]|nr:hypothetical protein [Pseudomonas putida]
MTIDKAQLRGLAEACEASRCADEEDEGRRLSEFHSELTPEAMLELLAEIDQLKLALDMESAELAWSDSDGRAIQAERDQLKAENEDYKSGQERYEQIIEDLKAENEALRRDAERYQWLRQGMGKVIVVEPDNAVSCDCDRYEVLLESEVDDAVDADIAKEAAHD